MIPDDKIMLLFNQDDPMPHVTPMAANSALILDTVVIHNSTAVT
jgi:hypothetical protein